MRLALSTDHLVRPALPVTSRFPHHTAIESGGQTHAPAEVVARLAPYLTEARRARIAEVVAGRTYSVVPVLERVHDLGNVNAVLRSAEGLGYGAAHLVDLQGDAAAWATQRETEDPLVATRAAQRQSQGADKWIDLQVWPDAASACEHLRAAGYRVVATHLSADAVPIAEIDFSRPTAIVLGNERDGVSEAMLALADANCVLPIDGFVQSYNISVAAALAFYHARLDRLNRLGRHGDLSAAEQEILTAHYYLRSVRAPELLLSRGTDESMTL
jgi:tRNA (guanosine-2'-O-)-methyltransferase